MKRTNNQIAMDQSKLTGKYVIVHECERWGDKRKSGYNIYKDGKFIERLVSLADIKKYSDMDNSEWMDVEKSKK